MKTQETSRNKGKWYNLKNVFDEKINIIYCAVEIRKISGGLELKTKDNYLGKNLSAKSLLIKNNKEKYIGSYVEICQ